MKTSLKTYILKGFDKELTQKIQKNLEFVFSKRGIDCQTELIDRLQITLANNEFLLLYIDALVLNQIVNDPVNKQFLLKKEFRNNQLLLITEDVSVSQLPDYLHHFQVFSLQPQHSFIDEETENTETENSRSNLFDIINDVALFIKQSLQPASNDGITVYLGPFDDHTTFEFQKVTRELLHRNFKILPEVSNPTAKDLINNKEYLIEMLRNSDFAIHFIGHSSLADYPEKISPVLKINEITAGFCNSPEGTNLQRIIYVPAESAETPEIISQKILQFKSDASSLANAELLQTPIEKLKEIILQKVNEFSAPVEREITEELPASDIYFIYPPDADDESKIYLEWLDHQNLHYSRSQVNLDQLELLYYHQKQLTNAKAVMIAYKGNKPWLDRKLSDLIKAPGWGRTNPYQFIGICGPQIESKHFEKLKSYPLFFIDHPSKLDQLALKELLVTKNSL